MLVPFGDCLNHNKHGCTYYMINKKFEKNFAKEENNNNTPKSYSPKKEKINIEIFDEFKSNINSNYKNLKATYIKLNKLLLKDGYQKFQEDEIDNLDSET